jgi:hypothetical protein
MYLKNDKIIVTIKDTVFRSSRIAPYGQFVLDPVAMVGWTDGTAARRDATVRPVSNGDFSEPYTFSSRLISLSGTAVALNRAELQTMRDQLTGLFRAGEYVEMSVETSSDTRYATVGLEGAVSWTQQLDNVAVFKIDLYAPDPHIYGPMRVFQAGANVTLGGLQYRLSYPLDYNLAGENTIQTVKNNGNADAWPTFVVTGDYFSGFSVEDNLGKVITYAGMVTFSAPVIIDTAKGTATQNGVDKTTLVNRRDWFSIPAGATIQPTFTPIQNGSGWCDIMYRDTWI